MEGFERRPLTDVDDTQLAGNGLVSIDDWASLQEYQAIEKARKEKRKEESKKNNKFRYKKWLKTASNRELSAFILKTLIIN